jgi:predicted anti-sigma-YlaC factor YlaD
VKTRERHLSAEVLFDCVVAGPSVPQRAHLNECALCASEMQRTAKLVGGARETISEWTASLQGSDAAFLQKIAARRQGRQYLRVLEYAMAALLVLLVPAVVVEQRHAEKVRRQADDVLLMQVDAALQESEPDAMRPLATLVSWREDGMEGSGQQEQPRREEKR